MNRLNWKKIWRKYEKDWDKYGDVDWQKRLEKYTEKEVERYIYDMSLTR